MTATGGRNILLPSVHRCTSTASVAESVPFSLEQAQAFVVVAEELHFGRAAARLSMTQPPLSRHIQKLERRLGVALLIRDRRGVELTEAGAQFLADCRSTLEMARQSATRARDAAGSPSLR